MESNIWIFNKLYLIPDQIFPDMHMLNRNTCTKSPTYTLSIHQRDLEIQKTLNFEIKWSFW